MVRQVQDQEVKTVCIPKSGPVAVTITIHSPRSRQDQGDNGCPKRSQKTHLWDQDGQGLRPALAGSEQISTPATC